MTRSLPVRWTRDELLIALNLYHKLTFGLLHSKQPAIITLAEKFGRGSNSVAMKLCNLASLDPALKLRGIKGLEGASKLDREIWQEFYENPNETIPASVKQRRGQEYFRDAVLNNFGGCCGISQLAIRELLIASHILPWGSHEPERLNVRNGLCLSRLHDAAFDRGLIAFDDNLCLVLSQELKNELPKRAVAENFGAYESAVLQLPSDAVLPEMDFLATHRARIFRK
jgi:putative restriction endonuclease